MSAFVWDVAGGNAPVIITSSAGVFDSTGNLVRTLWSASVSDPRAINPTWDGTLDDGTVAPTGTYSIRVLSHSVGYTWEGVVGNSSVDHSASVNGVEPAVSTLNYNSHGGQIWDLCITAAGEMYYTTGYDERKHTFRVSTTANPDINNSILVQGFRDTGTHTGYCCTDGTYTFFDWEPGGGDTGVWAVNCATKVPVPFASGVNQTLDSNTVSVISRIPGDPNGGITDVAVQTTGNNVFFVCRTQKNTIYTLNKLTGAALASFTSFTHPGAMDCNPTTGDLWLTHWLVTTITPAYAVLNLRQAQGCSVTAQFASGSWTYSAPSGFSSIGAGVTFDPATASPGIVLSGGNLTASNPSSGTTGEYVYSTLKGGKIYFEFVVNTDADPTINDIAIGISADTTGRSSGLASLGQDPTSLGYLGGNSPFFATVWVNTGIVDSGPPTYTTGDNIGVAFDPTINSIWFRKNGGNWNHNASANPATGAGGIGTTSKIGGVVYSSPVISKMTVSAGGVLTDSGVAISGLTNPLEVAVSPDGTMVLVADGGTSQQVKAFNTSDGSVKTAWGTSGVLGTAGGYVNSPAVTNTKFMFHSWLGFAGQGDGAFIAFQSDGSFWLGDNGNCRYLHFTSGNSPTYDKQFGYIPGFYSTAVCYNDDTRLFAYWLDYKIDYSKPLLPGNGSWTLTNNWFGNVPQFDNFNSSRFVGTFSNGRTYAPQIANNTVLPNVSVYELTSSGFRDTGKVMSPFLYVDRGFNLWAIAQVFPPGGNAVYLKNPLTGFDGSGNPTWQFSTTSTAGWTTVLTSQTLPALFPAVGNNPNSPSNMVEPLANGIIPVFNPSSEGGASDSNNHLGGIDSATGNVKFSAHPVTPTVTHGGLNTFLRFAEAPYFELGSVINSNGVGAGGGGSIFYKPGATDLFTMYAGESWGQNQTNMLFHWHDSGLLINRFGVTGPYFGANTNIDGSIGTITAVNIDAVDNGSSHIAVESYYSWMGLPGFAGNSKWGGVALQNGKYYFYQNDEWYHGGVHRWRIDNLGSVQLGSPITVSWNSGSFVPPSAGLPDLLAGLPYATFNLPSGSAGWVRNPTIDTGGNSNYVGTPPWFRIYTNAIISNPHVSPDLVFEAATAGPYTATLSRSWTRGGSGNWSLNSVVVFSGLSAALNGPQMNFHIDILDATGKKIIRLDNTLQQIVGSSPHGTCLYINGISNNLPIRAPLNNNFTTWQNYCGAPRSLIVAANIGGNTIQVTYGDYTRTVTGVLDAGADITTPSELLLTYVTDSGAAGTYAGLCFTKLMFLG